MMLHVENKCVSIFSQGQLLHVLIVCLKNDANLTQ